MLSRLVFSALVGLSLSACARTPEDVGLLSPTPCTVVDRLGLIWDGRCTAFELSWTPGATRLSVVNHTPADISIQELSGSYRWLTVREVSPGLFCRLTKPYPQERVVTQDCRRQGDAGNWVQVRG
ncbi:MAG: hypothetical protein WCH83_15835 [Alphaproteobacteria bacterium]